jgi:selenocysteine-specific elongation factor
VLDVGEPFVIREAGRRETVAGGVVLDVDPPRRRDDQGWRRLAERDDMTREQVASALVADAGAIRASAVFRRTGIRAEVAAGAGTVAAGPWLMAATWLGSITDRVRAELSAFHAAHPLVAGLELVEARALVRSALGPDADPSLAEAVVDHLVRTQSLAREGTVIRLPDHHASTAGREDADRLVAAVASAEPTPPTVHELMEAGFPRDLILATCADGRLVRVAPDIVATPALLERAEAILRAADRTTGITVSTFRAALGTSRKYALPILEHFDRRGITRREGDVRVVRG